MADVLQYAAALDRAACEHAEGRLQLAAWSTSAAVAAVAAARARAPPDGSRRTELLARLGAALECNASLCEAGAGAGAGGGVGDEGRGEWTGLIHAATAFALAQPPRPPRHFDPLAAALQYNAACAHARAGRAREALVALAEAVGVARVGGAATSASAPAGMAAWLLAADDAPAEAEAAAAAAVAAPRAPTAGGGLRAVLRCAQALLRGGAGEVLVPRARSVLLACARLALWLRLGSQPRADAAAAGDGGDGDDGGGGRGGGCDAAEAAEWLDWLVWLAREHAAADAAAAAQRPGGSPGERCESPGGERCESPGGEWAPALARLAVRAVRLLVHAHARALAEADDDAALPPRLTGGAAPADAALWPGGEHAARAADAAARAVGALAALTEAVEGAGAAEAEGAPCLADARGALGVAHVLLGALPGACQFESWAPAGAQIESWAVPVMAAGATTAARPRTGALAAAERLLEAAVGVGGGGSGAMHALLALACVRGCALGGGDDDGAGGGASGGGGGDGDHVLAPLRRVLELAAAAAPRVSATASSSRLAVERASAFGAMARYETAGCAEASAALLSLLQRGTADATDDGGGGGGQSSGEEDGRGGVEYRGDSAATVRRDDAPRRKRARRAEPPAAAAAAAASAGRDQLLFCVRAPPLRQLPSQPAAAADGTDARVRAAPALHCWEVDGAAAPLAGRSLRYARARLDARAGRWARAAARYGRLADCPAARRALDGVGVSPHELVLELGYAALRAGLLEETTAARALPASATRAERATARLYAAEASLRLGRPEGALAMLADDASAPLPPRLASAVANARACAHAALGRWDRAAAALGAALGAPADADAQTAVNRALVELGGGRLGGATAGWRAWRLGAGAGAGAAGSPSELDAAIAALDRRLGAPESEEMTI